MKDNGGVKDVMAFGAGGFEAGQASPNKHLSTGSDILGPDNGTNRFMSELRCSHKIPIIMILSDIGNH